MVLFDAHLHTAHDTDFISPPDWYGFSCASTPGDWHRLQSENRPEITVFLGLHPEALDKTDEETQPLLEKLTALLDAMPGTGVGECGIDRRFFKTRPRTFQEMILEVQIEAAVRLRRPLVLHEVRASGILAEILERLQPDIPVMLHGFRGKEETARRYLKGGTFLSLGPGQHWNDEGFRKMVRSLPREKLLLESDWPYAPAPYLTTLDNLYTTAAGVLGIDREELSDIVRTNGKVFTH